MLGGLETARIIDRAGFGRTFGGPVRPPAVTADEKPTEEDRSMGAALAAAIGADQPSDCTALEPRHRAGCRTYVESRGRELPIEPLLPFGD